MEPERGGQSDKIHRNSSGPRVLAWKSILDDARSKNDVKETPSPCLLCCEKKTSKGRPIMSNQSRHSYVQFYPSDWLGGMGFMPPMAEWLYLQICLYNWDKREPLPEKEARLRLSRSPTWEEDLALLIDASKVIKTAGGSFFVERAMIEAERSYELWEKKSRGGKRSKPKQLHDDAEDSNKSDANTLRSNENENESETCSNEQGASAGGMIFSVPDPIMRAFRDHRRKLKSPMTPHAEKLIIGKLEKINRERGHDPTAVLEQSIESGWKGVFELKGAGNDNRNNKSGGSGLLDACTE